jgi:purine-binding chemotaxis protein CheW
MTESLAFDAHGASADTSQFLTFLLDGEEYGLDILRVQELRAWRPVTPLPNTPHWILGVINLRGLIVPIADLRRRFGLPEVAYGATTVVIVVRVTCRDAGGSRERVMGVVVDAVSDVYQVAAADRQPTPDVGGAAAAFVQGLATVADKMVILLDIDGLLEAASALSPAA